MKYYKSLIILISIYLSSCTYEKNDLTIEGNRFYLNGEKISLWGIRAASATQSDAYTDKLIDALDDYRSHGVNSVNIYLQGSSGGFSDPFIDSGKRIKEDHFNRLIRIINACENHSIVPIVGIFYQRTLANLDSVRNLHHPDDIYRAVGIITKKLIPYRNLVINIANEQNSFFYSKFEEFDFRDPENIIGLSKHIKSIDPGRIVGGGGYNDSLNIIIGKSEFVDVLLFDTSPDDVEKNHNSAWHYDYFRESGVPDKPMINVEIFGGWTKKYMPPGVYPQADKDLHTREIDVSLTRPGLSVHFHSNPWCQGPSMGNYPVRYDLGGDGSEENPGIQWWFDHLVKSTKK